MERARTHPILIAAGVAALLFSLLGAAALTFGGATSGDRVRISGNASIERA